jgi:hypothetical protein
VLPGVGLWFWLCAMRVKSPFSQSASFGFMGNYTDAASTNGMTL